MWASFTRVSFPPAYCLVWLITAIQGAAKRGCCCYYDQFWIYFLSHCCYIMIVSHMSVHFFCSRKHAAAISHRTLYYLWSFAYRFYGGINHVSIFQQLWFLDPLFFVYNLASSSRFLVFLASLRSMPFGSCRSKVAQGLLGY